MQTRAEIVMEALQDGPFARAIEERARVCAAQRAALVSSFTVPVTEEPDRKFVKRVIFTDDPAFAHWWRSHRASEGSRLT